MIEYISTTQKIKTKKFLEKQKIKVERVRTCKTNKTNIKKPTLIPLSNQFINVLERAEMETIKKELKNTHPHEKMLYQIWDEEKNIQGELHFTLHGTEWYMHVYQATKNNRTYTSALMQEENQKKQLSKNGERTIQMERKWIVKEKQG